MDNFWIILLVAIGIACIVTEDWCERIMMVVYYALGLLFAVHIDGWVWKLIFVVIVGTILREEDDGHTPFSPSLMVAGTIITGMVLYTICGKWLSGFGLRLASVITTLMSIIVVISAKKSNKSATE